MDSSNRSSGMASHSLNETTRLFPMRRLEAPISVPLSILDCTAARFSPTGCIWIFDNHADIPKTHVLLDRLKRSFVSTLDDFPQWAGQLQWASFNPTGEYTERFNRLKLVYGSIHDPGIEWRTVLNPENTADQFVPAPSERICAKIWRGDGFPESMFISDCALALYDLKSYEGLPGMSVQISFFGDGGYAVGLKLAHPLGDAQSLMTFVNMWANKSQNLGDEKNLPFYSSPIFNPKLLDNYASGELNESKVDVHYARIARALPLHRYDCWECDSPDMPFFFKEQLQKIAPPAELLEEANLSPAQSAPWSTWDPSKPVSYVNFHFSGERLEKLRSSTFGNGTGQSKVSRLDILLSLLWSAINRARGMNQESDEVFLDLTIGARVRLSPPLPDSWLGSPLFLTYVKRTGAQICSEDLASISESIRNTMSLFTPEKISAMLHDAAYEVSPLRLWQSFLGRRHVMVTSWLRLDVQNVSFEGGMVRPRYAHAIMPKVDGVVQVFDSAINDGGMSVALYLDAETMEKLIGDDALKEN